jgi:hypothetical protein
LQSHLGLFGLLRWSSPLSTTQQGVTCHQTWFQDSPSLALSRNLNPATVREGAKKTSRSPPAKEAVSSASDGPWGIGRWRRRRSSLPAGGVRPSLGFSRSWVWFPVEVAEALAAMPAWNKSLRSQPRPVGILLRRRWRVCGGGSPIVAPLYRSQPPVFLHLRVRRGDEQASLLMQGSRGSCGSAAGWRMDRARSPRDGGCRRRRASVQAGRCSGRDPGRLGDQQRRISYYEYLFRLSSKPQCDGASSGLGMVVAARFAGAGGVWRRWIWSPLSSTRSRDFSVIFYFSRDLSAYWVGQLSYVSLIPCMMYLYLYGL